MLALFAEAVSHRASGIVSFIAIGPLGRPAPRGD